MGEKCDFLQVVKIPYPKNRFLVNLRSFFSIINFSMRWLFPVTTFKEEYFNEKMGPLAALEKVSNFLAKVPILAIFGYLSSLSKVIFSTYRQIFKKLLVIFLGKVVRNIAFSFELSIFKMVRGAPAVLQSPHFPKTVNFNFNFVER